MMRSQIFLSTLLAVSVSTAFGAMPDFVGSSAPVTLEKTTQVPGDLLKGGSYSVSVTEQIADRLIVRMDSTTNKDHAIFLGVPTTSAKIGGGAGMVTWPTGVNKTPTLRGIVFANGNAVEFVYPKAEAAALAKSNSAAVVAVDPSSEGRVALKSLSHDELQIVNLWLLSLTSTGPQNKTPAVLARHYDATQDIQNPTVASSIAPIYPTGQNKTTDSVQTAQVSPVQVASTATVAKVGTQPAPQPKRVRVVTAARPAGPEVAKLEEPKGVSAGARRGPAMAQLPHTAGSLIGVWMLGLLSLLGALAMRFRRSSTERIVN